MHDADRRSHACDMYVTCYMPVPGMEMGHFRSDTGLYRPVICHHPAGLYRLGAKVMQACNSRVLNFRIVTVL